MGKRVPEIVTVKEVVKDLAYQLRQHVRQTSVLIDVDPVARFS